MSFSFAGVYGLFGQTDSTKTVELKPIFVLETKPSFKTTSRNITALTNSEMKEFGAQTLSEALSALPGVSQITTGAISKPVIRGLYGNRLQVNVGGVRLEDQQWEDEHGLGLSDVGIERVELIKGPASLLYGSDAMGGVINIIEEGFDEPESRKQNLNLKLFSNTYGLGLDYGFKQKKKNTFLFRISAESHADYSDGAGNRVPNTRFALYNLKAGYIVQNKRWKSENRLLTSYNQFGFISDTSELHEDEEESRLSREFEEDHHVVWFTLFSSKNSFQLNENTLLNATLGIQTNLRQEQERGGEADLNLFLNTYSLNVSVQKQLPRQWTLTNGLEGMFQINTNLGSRIIVPDANIWEGSAYSYIKKHMGNDVISGNFETGLRLDRRQTHTFETGTLNDPTAGISPFSHGHNELVGSVGQSLIIKNLVMKLDVSTGFRTGNLAELSANGLHEGTPNWYIGNPDMKPEECVNADFSANWKINFISLRGSVFHNRFFNYIYLNPTNEKIQDYAVFRFEQSDATLQGFEAGISFEKEKVFSFSVDYAYLDARRNDESWLPFVPANKWTFNVKYFPQIQSSVFQDAFLFIGSNYTEEQNHANYYETASSSYWLFQAGAGINYKSMRLLVTCRNITGKVYADHLSRLQYYGLNDMGRNIVVNLGWQF